MLYKHSLISILVCRRDLVEVIWGSLNWESKQALTATKKRTPLKDVSPHPLQAKWTVLAPVGHTTCSKHGTVPRLIPSKVIPGWVVLSVWTHKPKRSHTLDFPLSGLFFGAPRASFGGWWPSKMMLVSGKGQESCLSCNRFCKESASQWCSRGVAWRRSQMKRRVSTLIRLVAAHLAHEWLIRFQYVVYWFAAVTALFNHRLLHIHTLGTTVTSLPGRGHTTF